MLGMKIQVTDATKKVAKAVDKAAFRNFGHAAASISKDAKASIETSSEPSAPGTPPHTRRGNKLRKGVRFKADKDGAVIGPMASIVGQAGAAHEFGGEYRGTELPERPFMGPALERALPRFAGEWRGSIGE